jgi:hypothetical protein
MGQPNNTIKISKKHPPGLPHSGKKNVAHRFIKRRIHTLGARRNLAHNMHNLQQRQQGVRDHGRSQRQSFSQPQPQEQKQPSERIMFSNILPC